MKRLTLVRHAKSSWKELSIGDFDRPLNARGKSDAPEMGRRLAARGVQPDLLVSSRAKRARKTARLIAREIGLSKERMREDERIYEAGLERLLEVVAGLPEEADHVLLVGHNPGFTSLANHLAGGAIGNLPTCGVVSVSFEAPDWPSAARGGGTALFYDYPKNRQG